MNIGDRIRYRREELNMSQDELAQKLGYKSRSSINKIEKNIRNLTQSKIKAIADALDTTPSFIMGWSEPTKMGMPDAVDTEAIKNAAEISNIYLHLNKDDQEYLLLTARRLAK